MRSRLAASVWNGCGTRCSGGHAISFAARWAVIETYDWRWFAQAPLNNAVIIADGCIE